MKRTRFIVHCPSQAKNNKKTILIFENNKYNLIKNQGKQNANIN